MPRRNIVKQYVIDGYYHVYNRGVEKRLIFLDDQDYWVFLSYIKRYLRPTTDEEKTVGREFRDLSQDAQLIAYCLMPNHFHFLVKQISERGMAELMRGICTRYSMYFNRKYDRVGGLFQGTYKAVRVARDEYLAHLSRYIHRNPDLYKDYAYSSYQYYLGECPDWLHLQEIEGLFENKEQYRLFVEANDDSGVAIGSLILD